MAGLNSLGNLCQMVRESMDRQYKKEKTQPRKQKLQSNNHPGAYLKVSPLGVNIGTDIV